MPRVFTLDGLGFKNQKQKQRERLPNAFRSEFGGGQNQLNRFARRWYIKQQIMTCSILFRGRETDRDRERGREKEAEGQQNEH